MIFIAFKVSKRRTIRNFYKFDFIPITSGSKQNFVGGIITLLYCLTLMILISGVFMKYFFFNKRIEATQLAAFENTKPIVVSYEIIIMLYISQYSDRSFDLCEPTQASLNLIFSHHYDQTKMKIRCHQTPYDPIVKASSKRVKAQTNIYEIRVICENCVQQEPSNSFIQILVGEIGDSAQQTFFVHFFEWQFNSIWSSEVDEEELCEGCSIIKGFTVPDSIISGSYNFQESFKGSDPTSINVLLTPTFYQNPVDEIDLAGYRVHLQNINKGSTVNARKATTIDQTTMRQTLGNPEVADQFSIKFQMNLSSNIYQIRVIQLKNILEALAEVMGFLAGFSFIARFSKHILVTHRVGY